MASTTIPFIYNNHARAFISFYISKTENNVLHKLKSFAVDKILVFHMSILMLSSEPLKTMFPGGIPRNSFIIIAGKSGSGKSVLLAKIVGSILQLEEPVLYLALDDDPKTVALQLESLKINVIEYVKKGMFFIVDGYSERIRDRDFKSHISVIAKVNPQNIEHVIETLLGIANDMGLESKGLIAIDSLNEFLSFYKVMDLAEHIKVIRANFSKARNIITVATLHTSTPQARELLANIEHNVDGVIIAGKVWYTTQQKVRDVLWRAMVKKLKMTRHNLDWVYYTFSEDGDIRVVRQLQM
ncbi:MAG: RAD55 family ATPase [Ignisphaera sp.]